VSPSLNTLDEAMALLADGDRTAFTVVFSELWPLLRGACIEWLGSEHEGEDAAQKALVTLFGKAHEYRRGESCRAWALTIAMWECRSLKRARERSRIAPLELGLLRASSEPSPEEAYVASELGVLATSALGQLSPDDQALVRRVVFEDGETVGPVAASERKRKQRAFDRLRKLWKRTHGD
jgi:RNA polymerase sigma-70 factor (ECF subfamily)